MSAPPVSMAEVRGGVISQVPQLCSTLISPDCHLHTLTGSQGAGAAGMSPSGTGCPFRWTPFAHTELIKCEEEENVVSDPSPFVFNLQKINFLVAVELRNLCP